MDAPLLGDTGGHIGTAPTNLHHIFPHKQNNHLRIINPNDTNHPRAIHPNETRKQSHTHIGGGNASCTPTPILKIKKCVYRYDLGVAVDDVICFKASYFFGVIVASS